MKIKKKQTDFSNDPQDAARVQEIAQAKAIPQSSPEPARPIFDDVDPKLQELAADARVEAEGSEAQFMQPKKRGRKKGGHNRPKEEREPQAFSEERIKVNRQLVAPLWGTVSKLGVKIAEDEAAAIAEPEMLIFVDMSARCIEQYLPGLLGEHANAIVLGVTFAQWSLRVYTLRRMKLEILREEHRKKHGNGESQPELGLN